MLNYFSNFMLKHFPHEFEAKMLKNQDVFLAQLRAGKTISIYSGTLKMIAGKIIIRREDNE